ncbi:MAG: hypothetical protein TEF_12090 [Rhizobiales bacterium NRL2]|jgi:hypothetical protein|nr:MAG: hypothetical protein TEF_12090 [Rhizobiales bacterium NRL2]
MQRFLPPFGKLIAAGLLAAALALAGCAQNADGQRQGLFDFASSGNDENLSEEERQLREDAEVFNETVAGGAATNALLFGGLCVAAALLGGGDNMGQCAIMAGIGAAYGAVDGYLVAKRQEAARRQVREIDLVTEEIQEKNVKLRKLVETSQRVVAENRERLQEIRIKVAKNEVREEMLEEESRRLQSNIGVMDSTIAQLEKERDNYYQVAEQLEGDGRDTRQLEAEIRDMNHQIAALERERDALEEIDRAVRIG